MSGRRAAYRVAWKNTTRNKKRTFYLVLLIAVPVMVSAMTSVVVGAGYVSPEEQASLDFGAANVKLEQWGEPRRSSPGSTNRSRHRRRRPRFSPTGVWV